jgi:RimJ/RimL family protein N-acetyltransferase
MIRQATVEDEGLLVSLFNDSSIVDYIGDDFTGEINKIDVEKHLFLLCGSVGFFLLIPRSSVCYEIHTAFKEPARGERVNKYSEAMFDWLRANTDCRKIVAEIPKTNFRAKAAAIKNGFVFHGINTKSFMKNGQLIDQLIYGKEL